MANNKRYHSTLSIRLLVHFVFFQQLLTPIKCYTPSSSPTLSVFYYTQSSGSNCSETGGAEISSGSECSAAASSLGKTYVGKLSSPYTPLNCYKSGSVLFFNNNDEGISCSSDLKCVCKSRLTNHPTPSPSLFQISPSKSPSSSPQPTPLPTILEISPSPLPTQPIVYYMQSSGSDCSETGGSEISSGSECSAAASSLGKTYVGKLSSPYTPLNCYKSGSFFYFNNNDEGTSCSSSLKCVCKNHYTIAPTPSPSTTTNAPTPSSYRTLSPTTPTNQPTILTTVNCKDLCNRVLTLDIQTNDDGWQNAYYLTKDNDFYDCIFDDVSGPSSFWSSNTNYVIELSSSLCNGESYTFSMYDVWGDGSGAYSLYIDGDLMYSSTGDFSFSEVVDLTVSTSPSPTMLPTVTPTTIDTVSIEISMDLASSAAATSDDQGNLLAIIADSLSVDESSLLHFEVTNMLSSRRQLLSTFTWIITFELQVSLSDTSSSSLSEYTAFVTETLVSSGFTDTVDSQTGATVDTSTLVVVPITRSPTTMPSQEQADSSGSSSSSDSMTSASLGIILGASFGGLLMVGVIYLTFKKIRKSDNHFVNYLEEEEESEQYSAARQSAVELRESQLEQVSIAQAYDGTDDMTASTAQAVAVPISSSSQCKTRDGAMQDEAETDLWTSNAWRQQSQSSKSDSAFL